MQGRFVRVGERTLARRSSHGRLDKVQKGGGTDGWGSESADSWGAVDRPVPQAQRMPRGSEREAEPKRSGEQKRRAERREERERRRSQRPESQGM